MCILKQTSLLVFDNIVICRILQNLSKMKFVIHLSDGGIPFQLLNLSKKYFIVSLPDLPYHECEIAF